MAVPLRKDEGGIVRVGNSRVALDVVVREFNNGADPESIAHAYPTLDPADLYVVLAYYIRNREAVDRYIAARRAQAEDLRREIETAQPDRSRLREKLLARRAQKDGAKKEEQAHASPAE
jgi:uncharacterized protein (DUF433 family)